MLATLFSEWQIIVCSHSHKKQKVCVSYDYALVNDQVVGGAFKNTSFKRNP